LKVYLRKAFLKASQAVFLMKEIGGIREEQLKIKCVVFGLEDILSQGTISGKIDPKKAAELLEEPLLCTADRARPGVRQVLERDAGLDALSRFAPLRVIFVAADLALVHVHQVSRVPSLLFCGWK
jgi:hypothetical protein